jgi:hypothetical protein
VDIPKKIRKKMNRGVFDFLILCGTKIRAKGIQEGIYYNSMLQMFERKLIEKSFIQDVCFGSRLVINFAIYQKEMFGKEPRDLFCINVEIREKFAFRRCFENLHVGKNFKLENVFSKVYEQNCVEILMMFTERSGENSILSLGDRAFSWCSEKVRLMGFSESNDNYRSNQNQRYAVNLKNFDRNCYDKDKLGPNDILRTSNPIQSPRFMIKDSSEFQVFELGDCNYLINLKKVLKASEVFMFSDDLLFIGNGKILKQDMLLKEGIINVYVVMKLRGGDPKGFDFSDDDPDYDYEYEYYDEEEEEPEEVSVEQLIYDEVDGELVKRKELSKEWIAEMEKEIDDWAKTGVKEEAVWEKYYDFYGCLLNEIMYGKEKGIVYSDDLKEWLEEKKENAEIRAENIYFKQEEEEERKHEEKRKKKLEERTRTEMRTTREENVISNVDTHDLKDGPKTGGIQKQAKSHKEAIERMMTMDEELSMFVDDILGTVQAQDQNEIMEKKQEANKVQVIPKQNFPVDQEFLDDSMSFYKERNKEHNDNRSQIGSKCYLPINRIFSSTQRMTKLRLEF